MTASPRLLLAGLWRATSEDADGRRSRTDGNDEEDVEERRRLLLPRASVACPEGDTGLEVEDSIFTVEAGAGR